MAPDQAKPKSARAGILRRPSLNLLSSSSSSSIATLDNSERQKRRRPHQVVTTLPLSGNDAHSPTADRTPSDSPHSARPSVLRRGRPSSILGSLKSFRSHDEDTPPATATSSKAPSLNWGDFGYYGDASGSPPHPQSPLKLMAGRLRRTFFNPYANPSSNPADPSKSRTVLHHGEVQNTGLFWKKKKNEYLVLTETHLVRCKNQSKASELFPSVPSHQGRAGLSRHGSTPSSSSNTDIQSLASDASGDKATFIPLEHVVAVYQPEDSRYSLSIEVTFLDAESAQGSSIMLTFNESDERELWTRAIRQAANQARLLDLDPISSKLSEYAARVVEREKDYDIDDYHIYKVVRKTSQRSSSGATATEDVSKVTNTISFLVLGVHKLHLIRLPKTASRSGLSASDLNQGGSFGILAMTSVVVSNADDSISLTFRVPFQKPTVLHLASLASKEIALRLRKMENLFRPGWIERPYIFEIPQQVKDDTESTEGTPSVDHTQIDDHDFFERTLVAYCVAYGCDTSGISYSINYHVDDAPRFELHEYRHHPFRPYSALELLAVFRALRYNERFGSISFAKNKLDALHGISDHFGFEHVCTHLSHGLAYKLNFEEQRLASLLVQEVRAVATTSPRLRRLDFSGCISSTSGTAQPVNSPVNCGVVEALAPLCKTQATNIDWIGLNNIELTESDLEYLVGVAVDKACHFRAIEASNCGLTDRSATMLLDVFHAHENTLEAVDLSSNPFRIIPSVLARQLGDFHHIRLLDLSRLAVTATSEPLLSFELMQSWRLEHLRLQGVALNEASVNELAKYLASSQSDVLRELILSSCSLTGSHVGSLMEAMTTERGVARFLHLNVSENNIQRRQAIMTNAIKRGCAPTHLSMRSIEYDDEDDFGDLLKALASNNSIRYLDLAKVSLPNEASEGTCRSLERLFAENQTLEDLDISGEDSRLESTKLGSQVYKALKGLKANSNLQILRIQHQDLGLPGANLLADVLRENKTLKQVHCECNGINLSGFTDLVNAVAYNTNILYLPKLEEGRDAALRQTEQQIQIARTKADGSAMSNTSSKMSSVRRNIANLSLGSSSNRSSSKGPTKPSPVITWSERDMQAALRMVHESWDGQSQRLEQLLDRNWRMFQGYTLEDSTSSVDEASSAQRPPTATSFNKLLEKVEFERTPTVEKQLQLGDAAEPLSIVPTPEMMTSEFPSQPGRYERADFNGPPMLKENLLGKSSGEVSDTARPRSGSSSEDYPIELKVKQ